MDFGRMSLQSLRDQVQTEKGSINTSIDYGNVNRGNIHPATRYKDKSNDKNKDLPRDISFKDLAQNKSQAELKPNYNV